MTVAAVGDTQPLAQRVGRHGEVEGGKFHAVEAAAQFLPGGVPPGEDILYDESLSGEGGCGGIGCIQMGARCEFRYAEAGRQQAEGAGFADGFGGLEKILSYAVGVTDFRGSFLIGVEGEADAAFRGDEQRRSGRLPRTCRSA